VISGGADVSHDGWEHALGICMAIGARLCTADEMVAEETRGTGCQHDAEMTWTSTVCDDGYITAVGGSNNAQARVADGSCTEVAACMACAPITDTSPAVRCCADVLAGCTSEPAPEPVPEPPAVELPQCEQVFLGPDIGFQNVFEYNDNDGTCEISMPELAAVCTTFFQECLDFLASSETPSCPPVFLGTDIGYANIMDYHDDDGSCTLSMTELAAVCTGDLLQACLDFLESSEPETPQCEQVFLGPDLGFQSVFEYHDDDGTCQLSMTELATVCVQFFQECMAFLASSEDEPSPEPEPDQVVQLPQCEQVFLGPDLGFQSVFEYNDNDGTCHLSITELAAVCQQFFSECMSFLESSEPVLRQLCCATSPTGTPNRLCCARLTAQDSRVPTTSFTCRWTPRTGRM
jgi:hypothetical protein